MRKALVTGSDGFIGSHLVESLLRKGVDVRAFVYYNSFNSWGWLDTFPEKTKKDLDVFTGDVRDFNCVKKAMTGCDAVFHLAALIAIPYSYTASESYVETNMKGTLNIVRAALDLSVGKVVHTSTSEVYGTAQYVPIDEKHPLNAQSPYAASKTGADQLAMSFYHTFELPVTIVRPFNTYGPRQSARAVIPTIITQIANGGKNVKLGSLEPTRDFNYVEDTVSGFISAGESPKSAGEVINIGSGYEFSIGETALLISEIMGKKVGIVGEEQRIRPENSEVERLLCDNTKARKLLNWKPRYAGKEGFKLGLKNTIKWFSNPKNLRNYKSGIYNV